MNHTFRLLSAIYRGGWLLESDTMQALLPLVAQLQQGQNVDFRAIKSIGLSAESGRMEDDEREEFRYMLQVIDRKGRRNYVEAYNDAPEGSLARISIKGVMMAEDMLCGPAGTDTLANMVRSADSNSKIAGILLDFRTPGGQVLGTESLSDTISACNKPTVAVCNGLTASAGYWAASAADRIIAIGQTTEVGSIGTMWSYADTKPYWEKLGINFHDIKATKSADKNADFTAALEGDYELLIKERLDPINELFHQSVIKNRGLNAKQQEAALTGKIFHSAKALELGLIDQIGTMEDALAYLFNDSPKTINMFGKNNKGAAFTALTALAAMEAYTTEALQAANDELEANGLSGFSLVANSDLKDLQATIAGQAVTQNSLQTQLAAANKRLEGMVDGTALQGQIEQLQTENKDLQNAKAALEARILATDGKDAKQEGADSTGGKTAPKLNYA